MVRADGVRGSQGQLASLQRMRARGSAGTPQRKAQSGRKQVARGTAGTCGVARLGPPCGPAGVVHLVPVLRPRRRIDRMPAVSATFGDRLVVCRRRLTPCTCERLGSSNARRWQQKERRARHAATPV
eukprot:6022396-Prymnesium_polylepis.1